MVQKLSTGVTAIIMIGSINCYCQESSDKIPIAFDGKTYGYMIRVPGGTFTMGSNDGDDDEKPPHSVSVSTFYIGETEVTQELWKTVMGDNPSWFDYYGLRLALVP